MKLGPLDHLFLSLHQLSLVVINVVNLFQRGFEKELAVVPHVVTLKNLVVNNLDHASFVQGLRYF